MAGFNRHFSQAGLAALKAGPAWWRDLLAARFPDIVGDSRRLFLAVRDGYLNAYVEGQSIMKIEFASSGERPAFSGSIHRKYVDHSATGQSYVKFDGHQVDGVPYAGSAMLEEWIVAAQRYARNNGKDGHGSEKQGVAVIAARNPQVIDLEMALPGHRSRIDLVALERDGEAIRLAFYEAKLFGNPALRARDLQPLVLKQLARYAEWLAAPGRAEQLADAYRSACEVLVELRGMQEAPVHSLIIEAASGARLIVDPDPRLIIFGFDPERVGEEWTAHKAELEKAGLNGLRLIVASAAEEIDLPGSLELQLAGLARFAGPFSAPGFTFGSWSEAEGSADGVREMPGYCLSNGGQAFYQAAYDLGWVRPFDWSAWMQTTEAKSLFSDPALVAHATVKDLRHMLTAAIRGDRFSEGALGGLFDRGILTAIAKRAEALVADQTSSKLA